MTLRRRLAGWILLASICCTETALAAKGDCSQPSSNGDGPAASDCLFILQVAVGSRTCTPECICAPKGTLPTKTTDALLCLRASVGQMVDLQCPCDDTPTGDDFNDNSKDPDRWGEDYVEGNGVLTETSGRLQFTVGTGTDSDYVSRPWTASLLPYDQDWEVQVDVTNLSVPNQDDEVNSYGISIFDWNTFSNEVFAELYASHFGGPPTRYGFYGELYDDGEFVAYVDTAEGDDPDATVGAVRIVFVAATKVLRLFYDVDPDNGYAWIEYGSFSVDGGGGVDGNANWGLTNDDYFTVEVYGYSSQMTIGPNLVYGDDFEITGGVPWEP